MWSNPPPPDDLLSSLTLPWPSLFILSLSPDQKLLLYKVKGVITFENDSPIIFSIGWTFNSQTCGLSLLISQMVDVGSNVDLSQDAFRFCVSDKIRHLRISHLSVKPALFTYSKTAALVTIPTFPVKFVWIYLHSLITSVCTDLLSLFLPSRFFARPRFLLLDGSIIITKSEIDNTQGL